MKNFMKVAFMLSLVLITTTAFSGSVTDYDSPTEQIAGLDQNISSFDFQIENVEVSIYPVLADTAEAFTGESLIEVSISSGSRFVGMFNEADNLFSRIPETGDNYPLREYEQIVSKANNFYNKTSISSGWRYTDRPTTRML